MKVIFVSQQKLLSLRSNLVVYFVVLLFFLCFFAFLHITYTKNI